MKYFDRVMFCSPLGSPDKVDGQMMGRWNGQCAGGSCTYSTWRHNPQFSLTSTRLTRVVVSLTQLCPDHLCRSIALYAVRDVKPVDRASLVLPWQKCIGMSDNSNRRDLPPSLNLGEVMCDINPNALDYPKIEQNLDEKKGELDCRVEDRSTIRAQIGLEGELHDDEETTAHISQRRHKFFPKAVSRRSVARDLVLNPQMGPITLIPVTETPGAEGEYLLTVQEFSLDDDQQRAVPHDDRSSRRGRDVLLTALPKGGGWHTIAIAGAFAISQGRAELRCRGTPRKRGRRADSDSDLSPSSLSNWGLVSSFGSPRSATSIVAVIAPYDRLDVVIEGDDSVGVDQFFTSEVSIGMRVVRRWVSSSQSDVLVDTGARKLFRSRDAKEMAPVEIVCMANLQPHISCKEAEEDAEYFYAVVPYVILQWPEELQEAVLPFCINIFSNSILPVLRSTAFENLPRPRSADTGAETTSLPSVNTITFGEQVGTPTSLSEPSLVRDERERHYHALSIHKSTNERAVQPWIVEVLKHCRLSGTWRGNRGGCFPNDTKWRENPQYHIHVNGNERIRLMVVLEQHAPHDAGYHRPIGILIAQVHIHNDCDYLGRRLLCIDKDQLICQSAFVPTDNVVCEVELEGNSFYAIIPSFIAERPNSVEEGMTEEQAVARHDLPFDLTLVTSDTIRVNKIPLLPGHRGDWTHSSVKGTWTMGNAGGSMNHSSWLLNPRFRLAIPEGAHVVVVLRVDSSSFPEGRGGDGDSEDLSGISPSDHTSWGFYTFDTSMEITTELGVHCLQASQDKKLSEGVLDHPLRVGKSPFTTNKESFIEIPASPHDMEYCIMPCTLEAGMLGVFELVAYWTRATDDDTNSVTREHARGVRWIT